MTAKITFECCSLYYLNQWLSKDSRFFDTLQKEGEDQKLEILKDAAAFYRVARTLKVTNDKDNTKYKSVLKIIDKVPLEESDVISIVVKTKEKIAKEYNGDSALSLTTKFLWLKFRHPIIIYDSNTQKALKAKMGDYEDFYSKWKTEYENNKEGIEVACKKLYKMSIYTVDPTTATEVYITKISEERWFKERVFDTYLWATGKFRA